MLHGGQFRVIPVRRPLTLLVGDGYAAVGDSAFMTTPMNGMGIEWHDRETLEAVVKLAEMRCRRNYLIAAQKRTCPCCGAEFDNLRRMRERGSIRSTICYECGRAGRKPPTGKGKRTRFDHDEIRRLHARGWRNEEIADMLGCTPSTVSVAIHELEKKEDK